MPVTGKVTSVVVSASIVFVVLPINNPVASFDNYTASGYLDMMIPPPRIMVKAASLRPVSIEFRGVSSDDDYSEGA